jgi:glycosyltransferase involved in cell wall biosynthesis
MTLTLPDNTGASRMAFQFAQALQQASHSVTVAHGPIPGSNPGCCIIPAMNSAGIKTLLESALAFPIGRGLLNRLESVSRQRSVGCVIGVNQRDRATAVQLARRLGVPAMICAQNQHVFHGSPPLALLKQFYYARTMRRGADLLVCTSKSVQDEFVELYRVPKDRTCVLPNGIEAVEFPDFPQEECESIRQCLGYGADDFLLVNSGRIDEQKGLDLLVDACRTAALPEHVKLLHIGDITGGSSAGRSSRYARRLHEQVREAGLEHQFRFLGWRTDVPQLLRAADGYVHAARWEGSPLAVLEAMAAELPCILPNNTSCPEGFQDGVHGLVVPPENPPRMATAIRKLVDLASSDRQRMAQAARQLACENYDIGVIGRQFVHLAELLVSKFAIETSSAAPSRIQSLPIGAQSHES